MIKLLFNYLMMSLLLLGMKYEYDFSMENEDVTLKEEPLYGVLDRFTEDDQAVILVESIDEEIIVNAAVLPKDADIHTWFQINPSGKTTDKYLMDQKKTWYEEQKAIYLQKLLQLKQKQHR